MKLFTVYQITRSRSDLDKDGQLTYVEFSTALQLIQSYKRGLNAAAISSMQQVPVMKPAQWSTASAPLQRSLSVSGQGAPSLAAASAQWSSFSGLPG